MRVMHVIKDLDQGGAQVVVRSLAEAQIAQGHEVAVVATPGAVSPTVPGTHFPLPETGSNPRLLMPAAGALHHAVRRFRPDVIHAHNPGIQLVTGLATARGRLRPALATLHGSAETQYPRNVRTAQLTGLYTVACGPAVADLMARYGRPVDATIDNGVHIYPQARSAAEIREEIGVQDGQLLFVQVGRLVEVKRPVASVEAFAQAQVDGVLAFAGTGELEEAARQRAQELGVGDRVRFLGVRRDAQDVMRAADVVMLTSHFEGLPLVLLEAMSVGCTVMGTRAPGIAELINDGADGILTDLGPSSIAEGMRLLASDQTLRRSLANAAWERRAEFSEARMADDYQRAYEIVISGRKRPYFPGRR